ncbi:protein inturned-like isoform X2 [Macrosteles quadrilineatus]|uniref:protein inturned-like isoform X2 n=1 Tax=Macrosteles quadrilineatus TaxID=74068 RepID=UPI0023E1203D|nr:protein inturned-like isoform X2 [Macrosteles quadrilineatus]
MSECEEQQSLLQKDLSLKESVNLRGNRNNDKDTFINRNRDLPYSDEDWSDTDSSSCSSYYSDCNSSSIIEWENEVTPEGELFYIESYSQPKYHQKQLTSPEAASKDENATDSSAKEKRKITTKGKLVRLIRRRSSRRSTRKKPDIKNVEDSESSNKTGSKVTFRESQEGECREVMLRVVGDGSSLGRRATLSETLLGLVLTTLSDQTRIMVAGFIPNSQASKKRNIKVGDWLKSINGEEIDNSSLNDVLNKITPPCEVTLQLQRVAECDITQVPVSQPDKVTVEQSPLVKQIVSGTVERAGEELPFWVVYATQEGVTETSPADQGVVYCYPRQNTLAAARGVFLTIAHMAGQLIPSPVTSTTIVHKGQLAHVIYTAENKELLLLAIPDSRCSLKEAILLNTDIVRCLKFTYQSLSRCFSLKEHHAALDRVFSLLQAQFLSSSLINIQRFLDFLPAAHFIALPRDAQVQIDDALSELESNDFGGYNDEDDCQRLYSIIGSCLFYKGYLLASHFNREDLVDVNAWCRHNGLLLLSRSESVRNLVMWREVFPASCNRGQPAVTLTYFLPQGRWFLLVVGQEDCLLALLLESGGCTVKIEGNPGPEPVYVKQAQATLHHVREIQVLSLADKWIQNHCRLPTMCPDSQTKPSLNTSGENSTNTTAEFSPKSTPSPSTSKKPQEVTSILKHRISPDDSLSTGRDMYETSEDSTSQAASSVVSDEAAPILGRRAERERATDSILSDSDFSDDLDEWTSLNSGAGSRLFDLSEIGRNLLSDVEYSLPMRLTAGDQNPLFCYVHLDCAEGVILSNPTLTASGQLRHILHNFRTLAPLIHELLQNTVRFKLKVQEVSECLINKTLIANKEHAMLFECPPAKTDSGKKSKPLTYWIVGRLFFMPQPREVYICFQDSSPQNMVEIACRLALSASG